MAKILAFAGSSRNDSLNKKLVRIAATGAERAGADVTVIDLADYPMPIFDQDLENSQGIPPSAIEFKQTLIAHQGFLIASPEYNSAFSPLLKNALDWASRQSDQTEPPLIAYRGKIAGIMATSPGALGGMRGLVFLRMLLSNMGIIVVPEQQAIAKGFQAFDENGNLSEENQQKAVMNIGIKVAEVSAKFV